MDYLVKIRSVQTPLNGQFSIGANRLVMIPVSFKAEEGRYGQNAPNASLTFRALRSGDPAIQRPDIVEADDSVHVTQDINIKDKSLAKKMMYMQNC